MSLWIMNSCRSVILFVKIDRWSNAFPDKRLDESMNIAIDLVYFDYDLSIELDLHSFFELCLIFLFDSRFLEETLMYFDWQIWICHIDIINHVLNFRRVFNYTIHFRRQKPREKQKRKYHFFADVRKRNIARLFAESKVVVLSILLAFFLVLDGIDFRTKRILESLVSTSVDFVWSRSEQ